MKFTLSWLHEYLQTSASVQDIANQLTALGLEVEEISDPTETLGNFLVAEILEAQQHPDADRLRICKVNNGKETLQIVCGAPNARAGIKVVLAPVGTVIPNGDFTIKASKIRGVDSNGMLCSETELGLGNDSNGIMELPATASVGKRFVDEMGLNDPAIEIAITPNRGDCLGVYGVARDLAAAGLGKLKALKVPTVTSKGVSPIAVSIEQQADCPLFVGRYFKNVKNGKSPAWLENRLKAIGLQPISALVDITNYISYSFGRPLHVYDADTLKSPVTVRLSRTGEKFLALDNKEYTLPEGLTVIADSARVLALGGVIGGKDSGSELSTTNVFLEVALFDPLAVSKAGRSLQIDSDARYRFERNVDPLFVESATAIASQMILDICGGEASEPVVAGTLPDKIKKTIAFPLARVKTLGGIELGADAITGILTQLGFAVEGSGETRNVAIPSWRSDVHGPADLVEEVVRIHGYDKLPNTPLPANDSFKPTLSPLQKNTSLIRRQLATRGLREAVTWSFMSSDKAKLFAPLQQELTLLNPISSDLDVMRPSILPNLLDALARNAARGASDLGLFEIGPMFANATPEGRVLVVTGVRSGNAASKNPHKTERVLDVFDAKADGIAALTVAGAPVDNLQVTRDAPKWYHPGRSGAWKLGKTVLGYFGEIHPSFLESFDIKTTVIAFELFPEAIPYKQKKTTAKSALKTSEFQSVERDFAFIVDTSLPAEELLKTVRGADKTLISRVSIFDVYQGKGVDDGKKSVAISVRLQPQDKTLTDADIEQISTAVIGAVVKQCGGTLRQ
ncbi:MAG: phenylalanine--tRNA ligase subunit beta [Rickettsiales bacterium]|jgi:phenylalanyl-tRNA synthetase beta chain|nr:phenylalanine--tRNA ligase subunit beta [Rickettsiales bacterium]